MRPLGFMFVAGEASGDQLGAELVPALRRRWVERIAAAAELEPQTGLVDPLPPRFFGAGGPRMAQAGVEVQVDMTRQAVIGLSDVFRRYAQFWRWFHELLDLACTEQPDVVVCIDFSGFNRRFAHALRRRVASQHGPFHNWHPRIVQYVSPQVWASRPGRVRTMQRDLDLLLSIFPFEKEWYARHAPGLRVEFVGHPIVDRYRSVGGHDPRAGLPSTAELRLADPASTSIVLLPGSRTGELKRHLPPILGAWRIIHAVKPGLRAVMVVPNDDLRLLAEPQAKAEGVRVQVGGLAEALQQASLALAKTGSVTLECAWFGVPTVAFYKTSWLTYQVGRRMVKVRYLSMPNILANAPLFPEFVQHEAAPEKLARAALELLNDPARRKRIKAELARVVASLGPPGAQQRAADAILNLVMPAPLPAAESSLQAAS